MEIELPNGTVLDAPDDADPSKVAKAYLAKQSTPAPKPPSFGAQLLSAAVRPIIKGVTGIPGVFADGTMAAWNLATGQHNEMPSQATNRVLDQYTLRPEGIMGKGAEFVSSALVGSRMPSPTISNPAPEGFVSGKMPTVRDMTLASSRDAGYVVPPSTTNPSLLNRTLESLGGKVGTAQDAAIANQQVTDSLARRALGMAEDAPLSKDALNALRAQAAPAYEAIRGAGTISADAKFGEDLASITSKFRGASKDFPDLVKTDVADIVKAIDKPQFSADSAVDAISILRDKASTAYAQQDKMLGKAYRAASDALESVIERNLAARGESGSGVLQAFRDARQLIAKSYSVENALNDSTGSVVATKLASQLAKGKPLSGDLNTIGRFAGAFPKAAQQIQDSGSVRNTDVLAGGLGALMSKKSSLLLYPFLRLGARSGLLSQTGQSLLTTPSTLQMPPGLLMGGLTAEEQARQGLFGQ